jgi:hypothetical protein
MICLANRVSSLCYSHRHVISLPSPISIPTASLKSPHWTNHLASHTPRRQPHRVSCRTRQRRFDGTGLSPETAQNAQSPTTTPALPGTCTRGRCAPGASVAPAYVAGVHAVLGGFAVPDPLTERAYCKSSFSVTFQQLIDRHKTRGPLRSVQRSGFQRQHPTQSLQPCLRVKLQTLPKHQCLLPLGIEMP